MKSWLAQGRRGTLLPRTNFLHFKVASFGRGKVRGGGGGAVNLTFGTSALHQYTKRRGRMSRIWEDFMERKPLYLSSV